MRSNFVIIAIALAMGCCASDAKARVDLYIDKTTQRIAVVQNGYMRYVWPVSTGRDQYATPNGVYRPERLERNWFSKAYYNSPMPYSIFFHKGYAIHGSYDIARLGGPASHGCVRLYPQHAAMLFAMVEQEGPENTTIVVGGDAQPILRAPLYRNSDALVRSGGPADPEYAKGRYPTRPLAAPYDFDHNLDAPDRGAGPNGRYVARGNFRPPNPGGEEYTNGGYPVGPWSAPYFDMEKNMGVRGQRGRAGGPLLAKENPRPPASGGDIKDANGPSRGMRTGPEQPPGDREHDGVNNKPQSEEQQLQQGYKVLPKSYWTGASWRWWPNSEPVTR
jgi:hypothetical protein